MKSSLLLVPLLAGCSTAYAPGSSHDDAAADVDAAVSIDAVPRTAAVWVLAHDATANWLYRIDPATFTIEREIRLGGTAVLWELDGVSDHIAYSIDRDADRLVTIDLDAGTIAGS